MIAETLFPSMELLREEYVLIQAWKKTAAHIRYHNWYSDTLELDRAAVDLPRFLSEVAQRLHEPQQWQSEPIRIVPAPKSQRWHLSSGQKRWQAQESVQLRPLAHVALKDQVLATALMLCIANRVETLQGDPRRDDTSANRVISYGNRLFCDRRGASLRHRWGSAKLYRGYYQDYRTFLSRPELVADRVTMAPERRAVIVHADLSKFYDRVRPALLIKKLQGIFQPDDDPDFFDLASRLLNWKWHRSDARDAKAYAKKTGINDFSNVALPQGLVSAGFFANLILLDFDQSLRGFLFQDIAPDVRLEDVCRYVDDLRLVLIVNRDLDLDDVEHIVGRWLQEMLDQHAPGLLVQENKTRAATPGNGGRPLVKQSSKMARIQGAVSGGFDAIGGGEILEAIQGLIRAQQRYAEQRTADRESPFSPVPDVRDATVARFAAARYRTTYRSLRPLLDGDDENLEGRNPPLLTSAGRSRRTRSELDDDARAFAMGLIENWVEDPSNVRLLRIGLDLWPTEEILRNVLDLLRPFTEMHGKRDERKVAWYCLAEIFRAGATETGFVEDTDSLPKAVNVTGYRVF